MDKLKGVLLDPQDARVVHATITLANDKFKRLVYPNEEGIFEAQLPVGVYQLTVDSYGFKILEMEALPIRSDDVNELTIHLEPEPTRPHHYFPNLEIRIEPENAPLPEKFKPRKIE